MIRGGAQLVSRDSKQAQHEELLPYQHFAMVRYTNVEKSKEAQ